MRINGSMTSAEVYTEILDEAAVQQIHSICDHPAFEGTRIRIMPDCHAGKGCVIGFTAVTENKLVVPNIVGVDIGCGILTTVFDAQQLPELSALDSFIRSNIPSGMEVRTAVHPAVTSDSGMLSSVSEICRRIGDTDNMDYHLRSIGTLGGGNHFVELDRISDTRYALTVHTGSRNLGKRICGYYQNRTSVIDNERRSEIMHLHRTAATPAEHADIDRMAQALPQVTRELGFITGTLYDDYIGCMLRAKDVAALNRRIISDEIMTFITGHSDAVQTDRFDTIHNYIDWYDDAHTKLVIRKGAISARAGERLVIPLNMRDGVIIGTGRGCEEWNCSAPHGAGRLMSRTDAKNAITMEQYRSAMQGISTWSVSEGTLDEAPQAYKPSEVIIRSIADTVQIQEIARPVYNFKAE